MSNTVFRKVRRGAFLAGFICAALLAAGAYGQEPSGAENLRDAAFESLKRGDWAGAEALFDKIEAQEADPLVDYGAALSKFNLGKIRDAESRIERAVDALERSGERPALLADCLVLSAIISARNGENGEAVAKLRRAVEIVPEHFDAVFSLARALAGNGDTNGAAEYFLKAVRLRPGDLQARFFLATTLENLGRFEEALAEYRKIIEADPDSVNGNLGLGVLLSKTEGYGSAEAEKALRKAVALDGNNYESRIVLGKMLIRRKEYRAAIDHLKAAAGLDPDNPEPHYQLSLAYGRLGMKAEAAAESARVKEIHESRRGVPDDQ